MGVIKDSNNSIRPGWKILLAYITYLCLTFGLVMLCTIIYTVVVISFSGKMNISEFTMNIESDYFYNFAMNIIDRTSMIMVVFIFWKVFDKKALKNMGLTNIKDNYLDFFYGLLIGIISISAVTFILLSTNQIIMDNSWENPVFSIDLLYNLILMILVGFSEELFSRGYCMSVLKKSNKHVVFLVPAIIFAILHSLNPNVNILGIINIFLVGILFAYMFWKNGNIWMPIGYHITWNYFQGNVYGLPVSGLNFNSIYTMQLNGESIINGGNFGPEGGLITTIILILGIVFIWKLKNQSSIFNKEQHNH